MKKICIIGSGLSGLACAHYLKTHNYEIKIFEKNSFPGGRARSEQIKGYTCDIGFQVLLNNYDELKRMKVYKKLNMHYFNSGAQIYSKNKNLSIYHPFYHPLKSLKANFSSIVSLKDALNIIIAMFFSKKHKISTGKYIKKTFSTKINKTFLYPFFRGVFLSKNLERDRAFLIKLLKKFTFGRAGLPAKGMSELPKQIIKNSGLKINYNMCLKAIKGKNAIFENGHKEAFDKIVLSMPINEINKIYNSNIKPEYNANTTCYFSSLKNVLGKSILLVPDQDMAINSIQCLSNISQQYSTNKKSLYSVSTLKENAPIEKIQQEFQEITGLKSSEVVFIKKYNIRCALPKKNEQIMNTDSFYFCGDWDQEPSIDGALKSGRLTAEKIIG